jgi:hypothetical protein
VGLYLVETRTPTADRAAVESLLEQLAGAVTDADATVVESRVTHDLKRVFTVVEHDGPDAAPLRTAVDRAELVVDDIAPVRLVGAELEDVKAATSQGPRYLVEWDLPSDLTMDAYLARKKEKAPLYDDVPEVAFRRTYVREDLDKCLCFYDAPCEEDVYRARDAVSAPVDRFHELA